jgi:hypothetical protein
MICANAPQFNLNYLDYGINGINTSINARNMNALAEHFIGSVCQEVLDYFLLLNEKQIMKILYEYIDYYNSKRPYQRIEQKVPQGYKSMTSD